MELTNLPSNPGSSRRRLSAQLGIGTGPLQFFPLLASVWWVSHLMTVTGVGMGICCHATAVIDQAVSGPILFPLNWQSSFLAHAGASHYFDNGYWAAAGYFFSENSVTELNFNPLVPDTNLHVGSLGVGSRVGRWQWALSGQLITGPSRDVSGSLPSLFGQSADGNYQWFNFGVNVAVQANF